MEKFVILSDRSPIRVSGPEAEQFLQGLITNDITKAEHKDLESLGTKTLFAGLLSPQGKVLFDFLIVRTPEDYLLDVPAEQAEDLLKRLTFYKLRAKVDIEDMSSKFKIAYAEFPDIISMPNLFQDPRGVPHQRMLIRSDEIENWDSTKQQDLSYYHKTRIETAIPEGGKDYAYGNTFPHEACYDLLNGVDFQKGCYVGQEVVSRMHHRGTARKRIVKVQSTIELPEIGTDIKAGEQTIGRMGSSYDKNGLALVRIDRAATAIAKDTPITTADQPITLTVPDWANYTLKIEEKP